MRAMMIAEIGEVRPGRGILQLRDIPVPIPADGEVLVRVAVCGVCHTELDEIEGRTPPAFLPIVPGHQVVGRVERCGSSVTTLRPGQRVGIGWIHHSSGARDENISPEFRATGRDANGGYAEFMTVPARYACPIPDTLSDADAAPLLCAGAVGFRALRLAGLADGEGLGLMGFGNSAHIVLQVARRLYPGSPVAVFSRDSAARTAALELGAAWYGGIDEQPPFSLTAIIDTTPAWRPVLTALERLQPGGRLVINAIRKEDTDRSALAQLDYTRHLWMEKEVKSVANVTADDIKQFLPLAAEIPIRPRVTTYALEDADRALMRVKRGGFAGAIVLAVS